MRRILLSSLLSVSLVCAPGCVTSKVQKAASDAPPAMALNLPGDPGHPLQAQLDSVIVFEGPGSWKRRAFWDEYVLSFTNTAPSRIVLLNAQLVDAHDARLWAGADWKDLERQSADWFKRHATVEDLALGAGLTAASTALGASTIVGYAAALSGAAPLLGIAAGGILISVGALHLLTRPTENSEKKITAEFDRRRLSFPVVVRPNETGSGSVFFRLTPSPQRLILGYEIDGSVTQVTIDLAALQNLHRKPAAAAPARDASGTRRRPPPRGSAARRRPAPTRVPAAAG